MTLSEYLGLTLRQKGFAYGTLDCCTFMADWLVACGLPDPMADRRGTYRTYDEYRSAMRSEGGLIQSCRRRFAAIGLEPVDRPCIGSVCLVAAPVRLSNGRIVQGATGSIKVSETMHAVVTPDAGLVLAPMPCRHAWGVPHG